MWRRADCKNNNSDFSFYTLAIMSPPLWSARTITMISVFTELLCIPNAKFKNKNSDFETERAIMSPSTQSSRTVTLTSVFKGLLCLPQCRVQEQYLWFQYLKGYKNNNSDFSIYRAIMFAPMQSSRTVTLNSVFTELLCLPQCRVQEQYLWIQYLQSYYVCPNAEFKNNNSDFSIYRAIMSAPMQSSRTVNLISVF